MKKKLLGLLMLIPLVCSCGGNQFIEACDGGCRGFTKVSEIQNINQKCIENNKPIAYSFIEYVNYKDGHSHSLYYKR